MGVRNRYVFLKNYSNKVSTKWVFSEVKNLLLAIIFG